MDTQKSMKVFNQGIKSKYIHECVLLVENTSGDFSQKYEYGGKTIDTPFLMASITKLFTTTCILILVEQGKLSLGDKVVRFIDHDMLHKLHVYKGHDYTSQLTISSLLFQTSGLPDVYVEGKDCVKRRVLHEDGHFTLDELIALTKQLKPHFAPNRKRAHYADINFDVLGKIIETVTQSPLEDVYQSFIFKPLELANTYLPTTDNDFIPTIYFKKSIVSRPNFIKSCRASGGCISTARELMIFIKAFFGGELFNKSVFHQLEKYNKLQFLMYPIQYGGGYMRIPLGGFSTLFMGKGELIGHSGSTGSFAFYLPHKDLFLVGDVNQAAKPAGTRLAMRLAISLL